MMSSKSVAAAVKAAMAATKRACGEPTSRGASNPSTCNFDDFRSIPVDHDAGSPIAAYGEVHRGRLGDYWTEVVEVPIARLAGCFRLHTTKTRLSSVRRAASLPPIEIGVFADGSGWLIDGNHRLRAAFDAHRPTIATRFTFVRPRNKHQNPSPPIVMWHGAQRWEGKPEVRPHKRGHAEAGAGIYTTTSYQTARSYAKGGGAVLRFELDPDIRWLEEAKIAPAEMIAFVRAERGMKKRKEIITDIERVAERTPGRDISAGTIVNLMVNHEAIAGTPGQSLAAFLVAHGIDASHDRRSGEDWVVLFNPAKIRSATVVSAKDVPVSDYDLPRIQRPRD